MEQCAQICTEHKDPAKMTHAKMALVERGLGAWQASALSQSAWTMMALVHSLLWPLACAHADESHAFRRTSARRDEARPSRV